LVKVGKETNHLTLKADILHYKTNLFTNVWIIVSLILIKITGFHILDAHSVWDKIEFQIKNIIPNAQINIHLDPFDDSNRDFCKI
jgi:divalent metal cation (Fe/Co/Zn/Cd) transporter